MVAEPAAPGGALPEGAAPLPGDHATMEDEIEQFIRDSQYLANLPRAQQDRFLAYLRSAGRLPFVTFEPIDIPRRA